MRINHIRGMLIIFSLVKAGAGRAQTPILPSQGQMKKWRIPSMCMSPGIGRWCIPIGNLSLMHPSGNRPDGCYSWIPCLSMTKIVFLFLICCATSAFAQKSNFSGTWKLDTIRTTFGQGPSWTIPKKLTVAQHTDSLVLTRVNLNTQMQEQTPVTETLTFDGKPFQRTIQETQVTTTLQWLEDNSFKLTRNGNLNATETWRLEDSGKTLVVDRSVEQRSNGFKYTIKGYYNKEKGKF